MGKITKILEKIRGMKTQELFDRHKQIVRAQAVREYIGSKKILALSIEVNLTGEEIVRRMASSKPFITITTIK